MTTRYKFSHRSDDGKTYYWVSRERMPGDSRVEQVRCSVEWFWSADRWPAKGNTNKLPPAT